MIYWSQGRKIVSFNTQRASADSMESANGHLFGLIDAYQLFKALAHLFGGFICEGDRQYAPGGDVFAAHEVGDTVSDNAGLATPRPCQYQDRPFGSSNGLSLWPVESWQ